MLRAVFRRDFTREVRFVPRVREARLHAAAALVAREDAIVVDVAAPVAWLDALPRRHLFARCRGCGQSGRLGFRGGRGVRRRRGARGGRELRRGRLRVAACGIVVASGEREKEEARAASIPRRGDRRWFRRRHAPHHERSASTRQRTSRPIPPSFPPGAPYRRPSHHRRRRSPRPPAASKSRRTKREEATRRQPLRKRSPRLVTKRDHSPAHSAAQLSTAQLRTASHASAIAGLPMRQVSVTHVSYASPPSGLSVAQSAMQPS